MATVTIYARTSCYSAKPSFAEQKKLPAANLTKVNGRPLPYSCANARMRAANEQGPGNTPRAIAQAHKEEQIIETRDKPQYLDIQRYLSYLQYPDETKSSTKDLSLPPFNLKSSWQ